MDVWAPTVRHGYQGTGLLVVDAGSVTATGGRYRAGATGTDCAAHATPGHQWRDSYGEVTVPVGDPAVAAQFGLWLRSASPSDPATSPCS